MANSFFQFKQFTVQQQKAAMKVTTDSCLFGAWCASELLYESNHHGTDSMRVLDIGTGTGLLSLMIAQKNKVFIDAVEIDASAAMQARENVASSPFSQNIQVVQADIFQFPGSGYDVIVSNPPFYENEWRSPLEGRNIAHHSELLRWSELFPLIAAKLSDQGLAFLLLPATRKEFANELISSSGMFIKKEIAVMQSEGRSAFRRMLHLRKRPAEKLESELAIRDPEGNYTELFTSYLQNYYLYL